MQTNFTLAQLADPDVANSEKILRSCVHCGFCTATCPTYLMLGDELDSPRGRIYLIKDMLEGGKPANERGDAPYRPLPVVPVLHDHLPVGRRLHASGRPRPRPYREDLPAALCRPRDPRAAGFRAAPSAALPRGASSAGAAGAGRSPAWCARLPGGNRLAAMLKLAPKCPAAVVAGQPARHLPRGRQSAGNAWRCCAAAPSPSSIPASTRPPSGCSPASASRWCRRRRRSAAARFAHHMGRARRGARATRSATSMPGSRRSTAGGLDAIIVTTSGCGTTVKDYGFMFRLDPAYAEKAKRVSALAKDISEYPRNARPRHAQKTARGLPSPTTQPARCSTASR